MTGVWSMKTDLRNYAIYTVIRYLVDGATQHCTLRTACQVWQWNGNGGPQKEKQCICTKCIDEKIKEYNATA